MDEPLFFELAEVPGRPQNLVLDVQRQVVVIDLVHAPAVSAQNQPGVDSISARYMNRFVIGDHTGCSGPPAMHADGVCRASCWTIVESTVLWFGRFTISGVLLGVGMEETV